MTQRHRKTTDERLYVGDGGFISAAGDPPPARSERERQMAECGIAHGALRYRDNGPRYDQPGDAVASASLTLPKPG